MSGGGLKTGFWEAGVDGLPVGKESGFRITMEMELELVEVERRGGANDENAFLLVNEDCNLRFFLLTDATYGDVQLTTDKVTHTFWFPNKDVIAGDFVMLWTGAGEDFRQDREDGKAIHHLYWGLPEDIWNDDGDRAVLMKIARWDTVGSQAGGD